MRLILVCLGGALGTGARYVAGGLARWLGSDFPRLSADLPLVIGVVDSQAHLDRVLPQVDRMMQGGLVTLEKVRVLEYDEPGRSN